MRCGLSANVSGRSLGEVSADVEAAAAKIKLPPGYDFLTGGDAEELKDMFRNMIQTLILAIVFIYLILASQFGSFTHPLAIMLSLPLSLVGVALALLATSDTLNIMSMIGLIMLMGLVTKNAILLIDFANQARREGVDRHTALIRAGSTRLRPIVMTTLAMIFGMLPLAFAIGAGAEMRAPMARAVIGGLITSTLLTLIVVPVVYTFLDRERPRTEEEEAAPSRRDSGTGRGVIRRRRAARWKRPRGELGRRRQETRGTRTPSPPLHSDRLSMRTCPPEDAALRSRQGMEDDEGPRVEIPDDASHPADLEPRDDAVEDVQLHSAHPPVAAVDGDPPAELPRHPITDGFMLGRDDGHGRVLVDPVQDEIEDPGCGCVGQDGIEGLVHPQYRHGHQEERQVQPEDDVACLQHVTSFAHQQSDDLRTVEHRIAAHGEADAGPEEDAPKDGRQNTVRRDVGERNEGESQCEPANGQDTSYREGSAQLTVAEGNERQIHQRQKDRQGKGCHLRQEHGDTGDASIDESAREEESLDAHARREDAQKDEDPIPQLFQNSLHQAPPSCVPSPV